MKRGKQSTSEIRSTTSETNPKFKLQMFKTPLHIKVVSDLFFWAFEFVSCFELRVSDLKTDMPTFPNIIISEQPH